MKTICRIKVGLVISSLILALYVFNQGVVASEASKENTVNFFNTETWPLSFQSFYRLELVFGDHKIDSFEAKYLTNSIFQSQRATETGKITHNIQSIAAILTILPADAIVLDVFVAQIKSKTNYSNEQIKQLLEEELAKNRALADSVKSLCEEIVSKGGIVTLKQEADAGCLFYQLLKTPGITPTIYSKLVTDNQLDILYALESLKSVNEPDEYVFSLADFILKDFARLTGERKLAGFTVNATWVVVEERRKLAELSEYMSSSGGNKLIEMLFNTIPHYVDDEGNITYMEGSAGPNITIGTLSYTRGLINFHSEYLDAQKNGKLLDVFAAQSRPPGKQKEDKSWLLFRYHPELIQPLAAIYSGSNLPAGYNKAELKTILSGVIPYGDILPEQIPFLSAINNLVSSSASSKAAENSSKMIRQAIGKQLNKDPNALTEEDYKKVEKLALSEYGLSDITLLSKLINLKELSLMPSQVSDINVLAALINLQKLSISSKEMRNIEPILNLQNLRELTLTGVQINDIYSLSKLPNLQTLNLNATQINDISSIANFTNLQSLGISSTQGLDLKLFSNLSSLKSLSIGLNGVMDARPLANLTNLQTLTLRSSQINNINSLAKLTNLLELAFNGGSVKDDQLAELKKALPNLVVKVSYAR